MHKGFLYASRYTNLELYYPNVKDFDSKPYVHTAMRSDTFFYFVNTIRRNNLNNLIHDFYDKTRLGVANRFGNIIKKLAPMEANLAAYLGFKNSREMIESINNRIYNQSFAKELSNFKQKHEKYRKSLKNKTKKGYITDITPADAMRVVNAAKIAYGAAASMKNFDTETLKKYEKHIENMELAAKNIGMKSNYLIFNRNAGFLAELSAYLALTVKGDIAQSVIKNISNQIKGQKNLKADFEIPLPKKYRTVNVVNIYNPNAGINIKTNKNYVATVAGDMGTFDKVMDRAKEFLNNSAINIMKYYIVNYQALLGAKGSPSKIAGRGKGSVKHNMAMIAILSNLEYALNGQLYGEKNMALTSKRPDSLIVTTLNKAYLITDILKNLKKDLETNNLIKADYVYSRSFTFPKPDISLLIRLHKEKIATIHKAKKENPMYWEFIHFPVDFYNILQSTSKNLHKQIADKVTSNVRLMYSIKLDKIFKKYGG